MGKEKLLGLAKEASKAAKSIVSSLNKHEMDLLAKKLGSVEDASKYLELHKDKADKIKQALQKELQTMSEVGGDIEQVLPKSQVLPKQPVVPTAPKAPEMLSPLNKGELVDEATGLITKPQELPGMLAAEKVRSNISPSKLDLSQFGSHLDNIKPGQLSIQDIVEAASQNKKVQAGALGTGAIALGAGDTRGPVVNNTGYDKPSDLRFGKSPESNNEPTPASNEEDTTVESGSQTSQSSQTTQQPSESSILAKLLASKDEDYEKYKDVLKRRDAVILANELGQAGTLIGSGISGAKPVGMELFKQGIDLAQQIPEDYKQNIAMDSYDPNSKISKNYREFLGRYMKEVPPNLTAAQIKEVILPAIQKENVSKSNAEKMSKMDEFRQKRLDMASLNKAKSQLEAAKARALSTIGGAAGTVLRTRVNAADAIFATAGIENEENVNEESLQKMTGALNQLPPQMISELTMELNKLLTGAGIPAQSTFRKLNPKNLNMDIATFSNYVKSEMGPANQAEYAKLVLKTASRVKKGAKKSLGDLVKKSFAGTEHIKKQLPEDYENVIRELELDPADFGYKSESPKKEESSKKASQYAPGQLLEIKGKRYKVGDDGDTLIPQ